MVKLLILSILVLCVTPAFSAEEAIAAPANNVDVEGLPRDFSVRMFKGIKAIQLSVGVYINRDGKNVPIDREALQVSVEVKIRNVGLYIGEIKDMIQTGKLKITDPFPPSLSVTVEGFEGHGSVVYTIRTVLTDSVLLERDPKTFLSADTWRQGCFGICPEKELDEIIKQTVSKQIDKFLNDYLIANPKK